MSVYSPSAAYQRKIEIVAVTIQYEDEFFNKIKQEVEAQKKTVEDDGTSIYNIENQATPETEAAPETEVTPETEVAPENQETENLGN